jgi:hypothetical protein
MPRRVFRVIRCVCSKEETLLLAGLDPAECSYGLEKGEDARISGRLV